MDGYGFWMAAGIIVAMVAVVLGQALRRGGAQAAAPAGAEDVAIYRDQLAEVDRDLARGTLPATEAQRLKVEISRRLLAADARSGERRAAGHSPLLAGLAVVALALAGAAWLYWRLGAPGYADLPLAARLAQIDADFAHRPSQAMDEAAAPRMDGVPQADPKLLELIAQLRQVVKQHPDDVKGLGFLARYEGALGNFDAAITAQRHLIAVKGTQATAEDQTTLAELMIFAAGGLVSPETEQVLIAALKLDPRNAPARYYSGLMFAQGGRPDRAFALWRPLLEESAPDAPWVQPIRDQIEAVAAAAGVRYQLPAVKGPSAGDMAAAAEMTPEERQQMIEGMVGGLEARLMAEGGPVEDWTRLIGALDVLGATERAQSAYDRARAAYAADPGALSALQAAARAAGLTP